MAAGGGIEPPRRVISGGFRARCHTIRRPGIVHFWLPEQGSNLPAHVRGDGGPRPNTAVRQRWCRGGDSNSRPSSTSKVGFFVPLANAILLEMDLVMASTAVHITLVQLGLQPPPRQAVVSSNAELFLMRVSVVEDHRWWTLHTVVTTLDAVSSLVLDGQLLHPVTSQVDYARVTRRLGVSLPIVIDIGPSTVTTLTLTIADFLSVQICRRKMRSTSVVGTERRAVETMLAILQIPLLTIDDDPTWERLPTTPTIWH